MVSDVSQKEEQRRLEFLKSLNILDTEPEDAFDRIVQACANTCGTPMAIISLIDEGRQWLKASVGLQVKETSRSVAFCDHTIRDRKPFVVNDARSDPTFRDNPLVTGPPNLRFYAGFPLVFPQGFTAGALAVMDITPRSLDPPQVTFLTILAQQVVALVEMRRQREDLRRAIAERDVMYAELQKQTIRLSEAHRIALIGHWEMDLVSGALICSEGVHTLIASTKNHHPRHIKELLAIVHDDDRDRLASAITTAVNSNTEFAVNHRIVEANDGIRYMRTRGKIISIKENPRPILSGVLQDLTEERRTQERLHLLDASIARISDTVMITTAESLDEPAPTIVFVNDAFETLTGYDRTEVVGRSPRFLQGPKTSRQQLAYIRSALGSRAAVSSELINYRKDGSEFWLELNISPVVGEGSKVTHFVSVQRDITQRKVAECEIERLAFYDQLTGLPNRRLLLDRLQHDLENVRRTGAYGALMFIDLDQFKKLNDTCGHQTGDLLLQQVARRLEGVVRRSNTVARLGGDEFVVMLEDLGRDEAKAVSCTELVAEKILSVFTHNFDLAGSEYHCTPSVGVTLFHAELTDPTQLFKRADLAMYQAKAAGRNAVRFFDPETQAMVDARMRLEQDLHSALENQEFELYYQPQADTQGRIFGAEALLRWSSPERGIVRPSAFLPLAEETGFITQLGQWVLVRACEQLYGWSTDPRTADLSLSVNISALQFRHPDFVMNVLRAIRSTGANPERLKLEVTESVFIERVDDAIQKMRTLRDCGIQFALDDFGTGYSSLSYLRQLPLNQLKIDQSFIAEIDTNNHDAAIAGTIVGLARVLGLDVIAEGVETQNQLDILAANGCHRYQGFFFSRPVRHSNFPPF